MHKEVRHLMAEFISQQMLDAVDQAVLLDIEARLLRSVERVFPLEAPEEVGQAVEKILRRAWSRFGDDLIGRMAEAEAIIAMPSRYRQSSSG